MLLTDPPYNVGYEGKTEEKLTILNDKKEDEDFEIFLRKAFINVDEKMKEGAAFYIFHCAWSQMLFEKAMPWEMRQQLIWNKNSLALGRQDYQWKHEPCFYGWKEGAAHFFTDSRLETTVIDDDPDINKMSKSELKEYIKELRNNHPATTVINEDKPSRSLEHPTMKPIKLLAYFLKNSSRKEEIVLDPFGGSGSTLIACEQINRKCRMIELDPRYCDVIIQRWENLTGKKAVKIGEI